VLGHPPAGGRLAGLSAAATSLIYPLYAHLGGLPHCLFATRISVAGSAPSHLHQQPHFHPEELLLFLLSAPIAPAAGHGQTISPYLAGQTAWLLTALGTQVFNGSSTSFGHWCSNQQKMVRIGGNGNPTQTNQQYIARYRIIRKGAEPMVQVSKGAVPVTPRRRRR
jgi:hypothetical protein